DGNDLLILSANRLVAEYLNLPMELIEGRRVSELGVPAERLRGWIDKYEESRRSGGPVRFDYRAGADDARWMSATVNFLGLSEEGRARFLFVGEDITDRKRAEEGFRGLFENASEGIYRTSEDGRFLAVNPALARIFGFESPAQMIEEVDCFTDRCFLDPARRRLFLQQIQRPNGVSDFESQARTRDGRVIWISESGRAVLDPSGPARFHEGIVEDISHRKQTEADIQDLNDRLRRRLEWETALRRVDSAILEGGDLRQHLNLVLNEAARQLGVGSACLLVAEANGTAFSVQASIGVESPSLRRGRLRLDSQTLQNVVDQRRSGLFELSTLADYPRAQTALSEGFT
ncbi:MAG TPA: PAS domain S-box protein, partial [Isosphaeraceae bacterium]|nr:PAS domain S-box protein [Isosphaeraceae bacterium]